MLTCGIESGAPERSESSGGRGQVFELNVNPTMEDFCDCQYDPVEEETGYPVGDEGHRSEAISHH